MRSVAPLLVYTEQPNQGLLTPAYPACATYPPAHGALSLSSGAAVAPAPRESKTESSIVPPLGIVSHWEGRPTTRRRWRWVTDSSIELHTQEERLVFSRIRVFRG